MNMDRNVIAIKVFGPPASFHTNDVKYGTWREKGGPRAGQGNKG